MGLDKDIFKIGVRDQNIDLFEGQYRVPDGMLYNSYFINDTKTVVMDTVGEDFEEEWMDNLERASAGKSIDYLVVQHMEPDHSANIARFAAKYPKAVIVASTAAFNMMKNYFGTGFEDRRLVVKEGDTLKLGKHELVFITAPMVHWPEVIMTFDKTSGTLFSADAFGTFGSMTEESAEDWTDEARRYYIGIVGRFGAQVQLVLKKAAGLEIKTICPLHGPVLTHDLDYYLNLYDVWSSYKPEDKGVVIAYTSVYGHTAKAVDELTDMLMSNGISNVVVYDLARCDMSQAIADAFRYDRLILATTTYNTDIFPFMKTFIENLTERNFSGHRVGLIENGSWAPMAAKIMIGMLGDGKLAIAHNIVHIKAALNDESHMQLEALAKEMGAENV